MRSFGLSSRYCLSLYAGESSHHNTHSTQPQTHALFCSPFAINNSQGRSPISLPKHTTGLSSEAVERKGQLKSFEKSKLSSAKATMSGTEATDPRVPAIQSTIRVVPDFPKPGILFQDITTLLLHPKAFKDTIDLFVERYKSKNISVVAGIEARGFIFGPPIALAIGAKFVPLRKPKKLPGAVIRQEYDLEYGSDCIEMHVGAVEPGERALVVDDLIATGGTLHAAMELLERAGAEVVECACVIEIPALKGRERLNGKPLFVLVDAQE